MEEGGGSVFSRPSEFMEVSEGGKKRKNKEKFNNYFLAKLHCKWVHAGYADVFIVWPLCDFCGLQPHMLRMVDKSARKQFWNENTAFKNCLPS